MVIMWGEPVGHANIGEHVEQREFTCLLQGMQNGTATLEDILVVSYNIKYTVTIQSSSFDSWYEWKFVSTQKPACE